MTSQELVTSKSHNSQDHHGDLRSRLQRARDARLPRGVGSFLFLSFLFFFLRCNAAFAILYCAEAVVPEGIVRLYAVVTVTDLVIRPRGRQRGSAISDLDWSKLRFVYLTVGSPRLETQDEEKAVLRRHQKPSFGGKGDFPIVGTRGECRHSKQQRSGSTTRTNSKGYPRTPSRMPIKVRTAPSWKSFSSLEGTRWI